MKTNFWKPGAQEEQLIKTRILSKAGNLEILTVDDQDVCVLDRFDDDFEGGEAPSVSNNFLIKRTLTQLSNWTDSDKMNLARKGTLF